MWILSNYFILAIILSILLCVGNSINIRGNILIIAIDITKKHVINNTESNLIEWTLDHDWESKRAKIVCALTCDPVSIIGTLAN